MKYTDLNFMKMTVDILSLTFTFFAVDRNCQMVIMIVVVGERGGVCGGSL